MRKQYKLIKEYPGSPKLGVIANRKTSITKDPYYCISLTKDIDGQCLLVSVEFIENYPEYWELIVEKDYEIVAYYNNGVPTGLITFTKDKDGKFSGWSEGALLTNRPNILIYSIKRLSDGEIFTVGDKFITNLDVIRSIDSFSIIANSIDIQYRNSGGKFGCPLKDAKNVKTSLFKTEDGVDIFDGDKFYYIPSNDTKFERGIGDLIAAHHITAQCALARFSTKEAAEEYILHNKPCLSINDILSSSKGLIFSERELEILAKSKLPWKD